MVMLTLSRKHLRLSQQTLWLFVSSQLEAVVRMQPRDLTLTQNDRSPRRRPLRTLSSPRKRLRLTRSDHSIVRGRLTQNDRPSR
jgi:hypothetical protein